MENRHNKVATKSPPPDACGEASQPAEKAQGNPPHGWISFQQSATELATQIREAALDYPSFDLKMKVCQLAKCKATCCHDGVYLEADEMAVITEVIENHREQLATYGWEEKEYLTPMGTRGTSVTLRVAESDLPIGFPSHFPKTRCVFLDSGHRCVLQRLAMDEGLHPWWWKPVSCWMHPLILQPGARGERPVLTLAYLGKDPSARPGYPGFASCTPCGMNEETGIPASQALAEELALLGQIAGRDLLGEL